jgi:hypothetical protein
MDQLLITQQGVDAAYRSPSNVSRLGAAAEGSHPPKRAPSFAYKALGRSLPLRCSIFSLTPSLCVFLRYSFVIYSFPRVDQQPDFDGFYVLSTDHPQLCRRVHRQVLEAFTPLRCVVVRLYPSL